MSISDDDISLDITLYIDSSEIHLEYEGKLYRSFRYTDEQPVYIGVFENDETTDNSMLPAISTDSMYEIIYFEISNGQSPYNLDSNLRSSPSLTIYLRNKLNGAIYDMGSELDSPIVLDGIENLAPSENDISWFVNYINGTYSERKTESTRSLKNALWMGDTHELRYEIAGYEHRYEAIPFVEITYKDIPYAGEMDFSMSLKIAESHRYREVGASTWSFDNDGYTKCFIIDNAELAWTAGANTGITYVTPCVNSPSGEPNDYSFMGLIALVTSFFPETVLISQIVAAAQLILEMQDAMQTDFNDKANCSLPGVRSYRVAFPTDYYIEENGYHGYGEISDEDERFELTVTMSVMDHTAETNQYTAAVASFKFRIYWASILGETGQKIYEADDDDEIDDDPIKVVYYYNNLVPQN